MGIEGVRIVLVDDHAVVRSSLGMLLKAHGTEIAGEAGDGESAVRLVLELRPDVTLMDITLPGMDGIEATRRIVENWPEARILALTMHEEGDYLRPFLQAGGMGFVRKAAADRDVIKAIETVVGGERFLAKDAIDWLVSGNTGDGENTHRPPGVLSAREREVLELTVRGYTSREIGDQMTLSPSTVETYRARIMEKLGLQHRHELVEYAIRNRLLG